ncbi:ATP-binding protein [Terrabacter sp. NPDC080008]|uniref:ATP-binding protein n=1 Tax=Terrabacter sp. NPDC080008 TaxID=3155176 RepID=UPI00344B5448
MQWLSVLLPLWAVGTRLFLAMVPRTYADKVAQTVANRPSPDGDTWVRFALEQLGNLPGVQRAGVALAEGGGRRLLFSSSDRDNGRSVDWCEIDAYEDVPLNHSVRTGQHVVGSLDDLAGSYPEFIRRQLSTTCALACFPFWTAGHVQGGYALYYGTPQRFDRPQLTHLHELGMTLGGALRRVQRATPRASRSLVHEPVPDGALAVTCSVGADPRAVAPARHFLRSTLVAWALDLETVDTAVLCLSELVTNAILHTGAGCELRAVLDRGVLTTTVRDGGSKMVVDLRGAPAEPLAVHGRGLQIVSALSTRWGSELDAVGMTVWFVLEPA